jgi:glycosyltransferase involved in cell wall biosynthesis
MISFVVPVYNEEESLGYFYNRLIKVAKDLKQSYEVIFIDDGSTDNSLKILQNLERSEKSLKIFSFRINRGKAEALTFGFQKATGDIVITLDADLQDRPEEVPNLIKKAKEGYDVVCGWRKERQDKAHMVGASKAFNIMANMFWGLKLHDYNCGLKIYSKDAAKSLFLYGGMHRFIPLLLYQEGFRITEIAVQHDMREFGKSKFGFSKTWRDLPDIFTVLFLSKYSQRPLHFFGFVGTTLFVIGFIFLAYLTYVHYFLHQSVGTRPLWTIGILCILVGIQISFTGFLADLLINISQRNKNNAISPSTLIKYSTGKL